jgi:hypothetical protein
MCGNIFHEKIGIPYPFPANFILDLGLSEEFCTLLQFLPEDGEELNLSTRFGNFIWSTHSSLIDTEWFVTTN